MPVAPPLLVISNESTVLTDAQVSAAVPAMQSQLTNEFNDIWGKTATLEFVAKENMATVPATAWQMIILDDSTQAGALGFHSLSASNAPLGKVFAKTDQTYNSSWTVTLSHEITEQVLDPYIILTTTYQLPTGGIVTACVEVADAVEQDAWGYDIDGVLVSDFCTPAWWGIGPGTVYDFKEHALSAFNPANPAASMPPGGYLGVWTQTGGWSQVNGADRINDPSALPQPGSRRERRTRGQTAWTTSLPYDEIAKRRQAVQAQEG